MASKYETVQYLLGRANIHDTATKMVSPLSPINFSQMALLRHIVHIYTDMREWKKIPEEVFAEKVNVDYSAMFGTKPYEINGHDLAKRPIRKESP
jgi:hypothetical protein